MELQFIDLTDLKTTSVNVRKNGARDVADLVPSIQSLGLLQPLLVRPNCERFEIVAGQRRYHALLKIAEDETIDLIPCMVMDGKDDARAIEASLAENIARLPMDEIDQYKAFAALSKQGLSVGDIAAQFGITERLIKQRLALGNLHPPILTAYRKNEIGAETLRLLTMATIKQQRAWWELVKSDDYAPEGYRLKEWLFGGKSIPTDNALFDIGDYTGNIVSDLFGEDRYFDDPDKFWTLQNQAIAQTRDAYLADGWTDVIILEVGEYFPSYEYVDTQKEEGGKVYCVISHDGNVTFYEGQLSRKDVKRQQAVEDSETLTPPKVEITKAMQNYLSLHRHAAVRTELLDHSAIALRLAVAQMIAGSDLWCVEADPQKANTETIKNSLATNKANERFDTERAFVKDLLKTKGKKTDTIVPLKSEWDRSHDLTTIFAKLLPLDDETITRIMTFIVAETLSSSNGLVEILGTMFETNMADYWQPEDEATQTVFFGLLRDKQAINAMLTEVAGEQVASANITATVKAQKQVIKDCINGKRASQQTDWLPHYMQFPMQAYTDKGWH